ncbi:MAG: ethanolamine ammonia-lyase reactivating factor EutA, partial [Paracoccaceae bacterium]
NVDIGGGTTKLALVEKGKVVWTAALHVGGRLIVTEAQKVARLDPSGAHHAHEAGFHLTLGDALSADDMARIAAEMARALVAALSGRGAEVQHLFLTDLPGDMTGLDGMMFSGGVGEYVYAREARDFGDNGFPLGAAIRQLIDAGKFPAPLLPAGACIRATALGASEYSVQLSGQTSLITRPGAVLPRRNLQVVKPDLDLAADPSAAAIAAAIRAQYAAFDLDPATADAALALEWTLLPDYARVRRLADGIADALSGRIRAGKALHILIDGDIAQTLGGILRDELKTGVEMLVIDGITLRNFDFIDLGRIRLPSLTVPVTIKSLLFSESPDAGAAQERIHFRAPPHRHRHDDGHSHHHPHDHVHDHTPGRHHHHGVAESGAKGTGG